MAKIGLVVLLCLGASAALGDGRSPTLEAIGDLLEQSSPRSKAEFLALLPDECKQYFTLVYSSHSTPCSSYEKPRIISTCSTRDSAFIVALNGEAPGLGPAECEVADLMETSLADGRIQTGQIQFHPDSGAPPAYTLHPARCFACHGDPPKYLADQYAVWPGFFESFLKLMAVGSTEWHGLKAYESSQMGDPVYRQLAPFTEVPGLGMKDLSQYISIQLPGSTRSFNEFFFNELRQRNDFRIGTELALSPNFSAFRYAAAGAALGCQPYSEFFPVFLRHAGQSWDEAARDFIGKSRLAVHREESIVRSESNSDAFGVSFDVPALKLMTNRAASTYYLAQRMGIDTHSFVSSPYRDEVKFPVPAFLPLFLLLNPQYAPPFHTPETDEVRAYLASRPSDIKIDFMGLEGDAEICSDLKSMSRWELETRPLAALEGPKPIPSLDPWPFAKCTECHRTAIAPVILAPPIPFDDRQNFAEWLRANPDFQPKIRERILDDGDRRMPPNEALTMKEKLAILEFLART